MTNQSVPVYFGYRWIIFFILLETSTVPLVAMSNSFVVQSIWYMGLMGFVVAFICVILLIKVLKRIILKHSMSLFGINLVEIKRLWYIGIHAGILLMIMFFVQDILFAHGGDDYTTGFFSGFVSVGITLILYQLIYRLTSFAIIIAEESQTYYVYFLSKDILILSLYFGLYELVACPITGLWIPYHEYRLVLAIISGILGGGGGGILLYLLSRFVPVTPKLSLVSYP